jgi:hypothetical protein
MIKSLHQASPSEPRYWRGYKLRLTEISQCTSGFKYPSDTLNILSVNIHSANSKSISELMDRFIRAATLISKT